MKRTTNLISRLAIVALAAGSLSLTSTGLAQAGDSTADNPHLRRKVEGEKAATTKLSDKDKKFIQVAVNAGVGEVADGKQAEQRGQSTMVKNIGARMVADHSRANSELQALAKTKGLGMDLKGGKPRDFPKDSFDQQYLYNLEQDHKTDIKTFEKEASTGDDADLKAWAAKTLTTLKAHLAMAKDARTKVK